MYRYKKTLAFIMGMVMSAALYVPVISAFATDGGEDYEILYDEEYEEPEPEAEYITSGDYSYSVMDEGKICIEGCTASDTELNVPDTIDGMKVSELGASAFSEIPAEKINIPATVEYISSENPFLQCENLKEITVDAENTEYCSDDGVLYSKDMKNLLCYPQAKKGDSYIVPEGVEEIKTAAFYNTQLKDIKLPDSLSKIGRHAFSYSEKLESADLSNTEITATGIMAYINCTSLSEVKFPDSLYGIDLAAFMYCKSLKEIELPEGLYYINQSAFAGTGLTQVTIPSSVMEIGYSAFGYDENDEPVEDFTIIGESGSAAQAYATDSDDEYDYQNNFSFMTADSAQSREEYLALDTKMSADGLYEYSVQNEEAMIVSCVSPDININVPDEIDGFKVTSIYEGAFQFCEPDSITLPEGVKTIGKNAFPYSVKSIAIPASCTLIEGDEPFIYCYSLAAINVTEGNTAYSSENGVLYNAEKTTVIAYPYAKTDKNFTAPESVRKIALSAFFGNAFIESADISGVTEIDAYAFEDCSSLSSVNLSKELEIVGGDAFYNCISLKSVRLYDKISYIGDYAFGYIYDEAAILESENAVEDTITSALYGEQEEPEVDKIIEGFRIYAEKDTLGYQYARTCGIEVVEGTVEISGKNVDKNFIAVITGIAGAAVLAVAGIFTGKSIKKKKEAKRREAVIAENKKKHNGGNK